MHHITWLQWLVPTFLEIFYAYSWTTASVKWFRMAQRRETAFEFRTLFSWRNWIKITFHPHAFSFALVEESETACCFCVTQAIVHPATFNRYPLTERLSTGSHAQFASENTSTMGAFQSARYISPKSKVSFMYRKMRLRYSMGIVAGLHSIPERRSRFSKYSRWGIRSTPASTSQPSQLFRTQKPDSASRFQLPLAMFRQWWNHRLRA